MKVKIMYPQIVINTIELEIPEEEFDRDLHFEDKWELIQKYGKDIPSYDYPDYHLCKSSVEVDWFTFEKGGNNES